MISVAKEKLADIITLSPEEMSEIMLGIHDALEEIEDAEDAKRILGEIERGEAETVPWDEVKKTLGLEG